MTDLTCDKIGTLTGGMFGQLVDSALKTLKADLEDRGEDSQKRTLTITIEFKRAAARDSQSVIIDPSVIVKTPAYRPMPTVAKIIGKHDGAQLLFESDSPDNPDQPAKIYDQKD